MSKNYIFVLIIYCLVYIGLYFLLFLNYILIILFHNLISLIIIDMII
jgi:hypothetical protein